jgi:hypothetical protein
LLLRLSDRVERGLLLAGTLVGRAYFGGSAASSAARRAAFCASLSELSEAMRRRARSVCCRCDSAPKNGSFHSPINRAPNASR